MPDPTESGAAPPRSAGAAIDERRWRKLYAFVLVVLALEIALFWAITRAYA